jgi:hypothetical protein
MEAVPGGVWLLAGGGGQVEVEGARMTAMRSIWQACAEDVHGTD